MSIPEHFLLHRQFAVIKCCLNFFPESNYLQKRARLQSQPIQQSGPRLSLSSP